jgi:hypothetical protein
MKPEGSLPCSQKPATGPCPEPYKSNPHTLNLLLKRLIFEVHVQAPLESLTSKRIDCVVKSLIIIGNISELSQSVDFISGLKLSVFYLNLCWQ